MTGVRSLTELTGRWWDWEVPGWDAAAFRLIADNDLTYHHSAEISFADVVWVAVTGMFSHPVFRQPTEAEQAFAGRFDGGEVGYTVFVWKTEVASATVPMTVIARGVHLVERLVIREPAIAPDR